MIPVGLITSAATAFLKTHAIKIIGIVAIALIAAFAYYQHKANVELRAQNYHLEATVFETKARMATIVEQADRLADINTDMVKKERELHQALFDLTGKFSKNGRDFEELVRKKPGLVAPIINNATRDMARCIEKTTMGESCE